MIPPTLTEIKAAVAQRWPEREAIVAGGVRRSWADFHRRSDCFARYLLDHGVGRSSAGILRHELWECKQSTVGIAAGNSPAFLEAFFGVLAAGAAPFNINFRYTVDEMVAVITDAAAETLVCDVRRAPAVQEAARRAGVPLVIVFDGAVHGAGVDFESAIDWYGSGPLPDARPEDIIIIYTGGTTGEPKGVLWPQRDLLESVLLSGLKPPLTIDRILERAERGRTRTLPAGPLIHGAALWSALYALVAGGCVVMSDLGDRLDGADIVRLLTEERITDLSIVGEAFAQPILDALPPDAETPALRAVISTGAALSDRSRQMLAERLDAKVFEFWGSTETGPAAHRHGAGGTMFSGGDRTVILDPSRSRVVDQGEPTTGWLARTGPGPRGYLNDADKTAETFVVIDGHVHVVTGDRCRYRPDGTIEMLGRDSTAVINTGGEKVFVEEVENVLLRHPAVHDAVVVGVEDARLGRAIVAVVACDPTTISADGLRRWCRESLAGYKIPRRFLFTPHIGRLPNGKVDRRWVASVTAPAPS